MYTLHRSKHHPSQPSYQYSYVFYLNFSWQLWMRVPPCSLVPPSLIGPLTMDIFIFIITCMFPPLPILLSSIPSTLPPSWVTWAFSTPSPSLSATSGRRVSLLQYEDWTLYFPFFICCCCSLILHLRLLFQLCSSQTPIDISYGNPFGFEPPLSHFLLQRMLFS